LPQDSYFIGGNPTNNFIRIWIDQIARHTPAERRQWWLECINATVDPFVRDRGYRWEIHIDETPIDFWTIEGMKPPEGGSDAERRWAEEIVRPRILEPRTASGVQNLGLSLGREWL